MDDYYINFVVVGVWREMRHGGFAGVGVYLSESQGVHI
jgi:hypothetical protein